MLYFYNLEDYGCKQTIAVLRAPNLNSTGLCLKEINDFSYFHLSCVVRNFLFDLSINDSLRRMTMNANWISLHCISILLPFKHNFGRSSVISPLFHNL